MIHMAVKTNYQITQLHMFCSLPRVLMLLSDQRSFVLRCAQKLTAQTESHFLVRYLMPYVNFVFR